VEVNISLKVLPIGISVMTADLIKKLFGLNWFETEGDLPKKILFDKAEGLCDYKYSICFDELNTSVDLPGFTTVTLVSMCLDTPRM
jgi:hypothetical protein